MALNRSSLMKQKYSLSFVKNAIIDVLKSRPDSLNQKQIAWAINLKGSEYQKLVSRSIKELKKKGTLSELSNYKYRYNYTTNIITGIVDINKSGNGYVKTDLFQSDVFVSKKNMSNTLNNDLVSVQIIKKSNKRVEGKIIQIKERGQVRFIGIIERFNDDGFFIPEDKKINTHFFVPKKKLNNAKNKDRVILKFTDWPLSTKNPFGEVVKILKTQTSLTEEIKNNIELFNIRTTFNSKIEKELLKITNNINDESVKNRTDFRKEKTFTIDPDDAKDFDDALSIKINSDSITIGIHIADVSHYIPANSEIDKEAALRAFSVYFPGLVIPMIPEKLSNEICSLNPNEDKLCFSVVITIDPRSYDIASHWVGKTIINSNKRFTYGEAEKIILENVQSEFSTEIKLLNNIAKHMREERIKNGSIDFERRDTSFILDSDNEPIDIVEKPALSTHKLVEEFMLLANKIVAQKLSKKHFSIYRIHDLPNKEKINDLIDYLSQLKLKNINLKIDHKKFPKIINFLLKNKEIKDQRNCVENLVLRAMSKANYSTKNIGHYGLGFEKYTHFTSPIRRYADLLVHRLIGNINNCTLPVLNDRCEHFSRTEKSYLNIERKTNKFIQLKLLEKSVGKIFNGVITGIVNWGIYIDVDGYRGEGLFPVNKLNNKKYYYNDSLHTFIGRKSGKKYILGQKLIIKILSINLFKLEMDLEIVE